MNEKQDLIRETELSEAEKIGIAVRTERLEKLMASSVLRGLPLTRGFTESIEFQIGQMEDALHLCSNKSREEGSSAKRSPWAIADATERQRLIDALLAHSLLAARAANQLETSANGRVSIDEDKDPDGFVIPDREGLWYHYNDHDVRKFGAQLRKAFDDMRMGRDGGYSQAIELIRKIAKACDRADEEFANMPDGLS